MGNITTTHGSPSLNHMFSISALHMFLQHSLGLALSQFHSNHIYAWVLMEHPFSDKRKHSGGRIEVTR